MTPATESRPRHTGLAGAHGLGYGVVSLGSGAVFGTADGAAQALPTTGVIGLCIVAIACVVAGAFLILRKD